jgi:hypothetical protein
MNLGVDEERVAIEAIATLVHIRRAMAELILKRAGVPADIYQPLLHRRDPTTGHLLSKREMAPLIIDAVEKRPDGTQIIRAIIEIAANWDSFHLAHDEYVARATVQKAEEVLGKVKVEEAREAKRREGEERARLARKEAEFKKQLELLLMMFDELAVSEDPHQRGYLLQELLNRLFLLCEIPVVRSFTRNEGAEQIDGAFKLEGWHYLVECRWRKKLADIRELDGVKGQVDRSGKQTMGFYLSINGWSENVPRLLKQNPDKSIVLMDGYELRCVLSGHVNLTDLILAKVTKLNLEGEPFYSVKDFLAERDGG